MSDADGHDPVDEMLEEWAVRDPDLDARPLEVVGRLLLCAHHLTQALVAALAPHDLTFGDFDVVNTLRRRGDAEGTYPRELARSALITSGAMTTRLDRLAARGLIVRTPDAVDRRAIRVRLTARGDDVAAEALASVLAADDAFLAPLSQPERDEAAGLLKRLLLRADGPDAA